MVRVFGLLIAALALMAPANAALLTYDFTNSAVGVVDPASTGTATDFLGSGAVGATTWTTAAVGQNTFEFTVGSMPVLLSDLEIRGRRIGGSNAAARADVTVNYQLDTGSGFGALVYVDNYQPATTTGVQPLDFTDLSLAPGAKIRFVIDTALSGAGATAVSFEMDYVRLNGGAVPEPASMAIFGLMGAGLAVRRFRRK
jgi:hypothetical protein